jgi:DNA-binding CsgD family transcriptional regulator
MCHPLSLDELSELIAGIYDSAIDPSRWTGTLERIGDRLGFANSGLGIMAMPSGQPILVVTTGMTEAYSARLFDYGPEMLELYGGTQAVQSLEFSEPVTYAQIGRHELWDTNRYAQEWCAPQGLTDAIIITLNRDPRTFGSLTFGRHESRGPIGQNEFDAVRLLIPHFQRSAAITRVIEARSLVASTFLSAIESVITGVVLVASDLRIIYANGTAARFLERGDPIAERHGLLSLPSPAAQSALAVAVRDAEKDEAKFGRRGHTIPAPRADKTPMVLHVLPLRHGSVRTSLAPAAAAAVFLAPATQEPLGEDVVTMLFDLTPTEATVFTRLADGNTVAEAALALGIGEGTVRTHLHRIFAKTGTRRQAELVKLGASLASMP